jgi:hypothetical protein
MRYLVFDDTEEDLQGNTSIKDRLNYGVLKEPVSPVFKLEGYHFNYLCSSQYDSGYVLGIL